MTEKQTKKEGEERQPFTAHLEELRKRIFISFGVVTTAFLVCFQYSETLFQWLVMPMRRNIVLQTVSPYLTFVPREGKVHDLIFLGPAEAFWVHMKIAVIAALVISAPVIFYEIWRFMAPGLHEKERRFALPFVFITSSLFFLGTSFCFFIVLPFALKFLLNFKTESLVPMISVEKYIDFGLKFILAFGAVFELPVVIVFLTRIGVVTPQVLAKNRKYAILLAFIAAALLTPTPDAFNQTLMAGPIIVLYEVGVLAARIFVRVPARKKKENDENDDSKA